MKENSIERDIHLLESYAGMTHKMNDNQGRPKLDQAIEHILSDYKRVLKENEELNNRCRNLDKEAQAYLEELAGDNTLTRRTIKQLQEENEDITQQRDYYKARYNEFNEAFIKMRS